MKVWHLLVAVAVVGSGAIGISVLGDDDDRVSTESAASASSTTTSTPNELVPVGGPASVTPDAPNAAPAGAETRKPASDNTPAPPASTPGTSPPPAPQTTTSTTAAPPPPTTTTTAFTGYWCEVSVPASASVGSTITAHVSSNAPDKVIVIRVGGGDDREVRKKTDANGSASHSFDVRAGDDGRVTAWVPWSVDGDPAECSSSYAVT